VNESTENAGRATGARRRCVVGIAAVVGIVAVAAVWVSGRKPAPEGQPPRNDGGAGGAANAGAMPGKRSAEADTAFRTTRSTAFAFGDKVMVMTNSALATDQRRAAAEALVQDGSDEAIAALRRAFANAPEDSKVAIAEALGKCGSPECAKWLLELLQDPSELVARGAVRGLTSQDTPEAASALIRALGDADVSAELRCEIASDLASVNQPGVTQTLSEIARSADDEDLVAAALGSLGARNFEETAAFFQSYLQSPDVPSAYRVQSVEALAQAQGDPTDFLLGMASDKDPEVRAAAAWAMSATEATGAAGSQLLDLLKNETDPDVRLRLYQALRNQESVDPAAAMSLVQRETDPSARVAGLDLLAKELHDNPTPQLQQYFDQTATAELKQIALSGQSLDDRQAAILALTRARTPQAVAALNDLASQLRQQSTPPAGAAAGGSPAGTGRH
jgi:HEAT repeat protein